jgi:hypothetical protein
MILIAIFALLISISGCLNTNSEKLQGNVPGNKMALEREGVLYFVSPDMHTDSYAIYRQAGDDVPVKILTGSLLPDRGIGISGDFLYYIKDYPYTLYRINVANQSAKEEKIIENASSFSLYDHRLFYWNPQDKFIYTLDISEGFPKPQALNQVEPLFLMEAYKDEVLYITGDFKQATDGNNYSQQLWRMNDKGESQLLLETSHLDQCRPYQDYIYYLSNKEIWRIDANGENQMKIYSPDDDASVRYFIVYKDRIYILEQAPGLYYFRSVNLAGKERQTIYNYRPPEKDFNGVIEYLKLITFNVTEKHLFLDGYSFFSGAHLITRIPIAGEADQKFEEVLLNGHWINSEVYVQ